MKGKIIGFAFTVFSTSFLIYIAVILFLKIWWVLMLLSAIIALVVAGIKYLLWRATNRW